MPKEHNADISYEHPFPIRAYRPLSRDGGYWRITYKPDGEWKDTTGGSSERSCRRAIQRLIRRHDDDLTHGGPVTIRTVGQLLDEFVRPENHRGRNGTWSKRYAQEVARRVRLHIRPELPSSARPDELVTTHFKRLLNKADAKGLASSTVETVGQTCRGIVTFGKEAGVITGRDPMKGVSYRASSRTANRDPQYVDPKTIPTMDQAFYLGFWAYVRTYKLNWDALHRNGRGGNRRTDACGPLGRGLQPLFVATSGLRYGEMCELRIGDIDLKDFEVRVERQVVEPDGEPMYVDKPKHGRVRETMFAGFLREPLAKHLEARCKVDGGDALVFPSPGGAWERRSNFSERWQGPRAWAGWSDYQTWHSLRHLFARSCLKRMALADVSWLLGHSNPQFTARRYLRRSADFEDRRKEAAEGWELD